MLDFLDGEAQPAAGSSTSTISGRWEDESVCQDDQIPGVLGSCQTFCQSSPSRQHDHRQWQDQYHCEWSLSRSLSPRKTCSGINIYCQNHFRSASCFRMFQWGFTTSRDERGEPESIHGSWHVKLHCFDKTLLCWWRLSVILRQLDFWPVTLFQAFEEHFITFTGALSLL